jgi:hypothetical protein
LKNVGADRGEIPLSTTPDYPRFDEFPAKNFLKIKFPSRGTFRVDYGCRTVMIFSAKSAAKAPGFRFFPKAPVFWGARGVSFGFRAGLTPARGLTAFFAPLWLLAPVLFFASLSRLAVLWRLASVGRRWFSDSAAFPGAFKPVRESRGKAGRPGFPEAPPGADLKTKDKGFARG